MSATTTALLERDEELDAIARLLAAVEGGRGGVMTIEAEAGAGKTSLLAAAESIVERRGLPILRARGGEYERDYPYGVIRQLFEPWLGDEARRAELLSGSAALARPVFDPDRAIAEAGAIEHGLYWLAADLAADAPLLLAVDDAQWADSASLGALSYLGRRLADLPVALLLTVRTGEPGSPDDLLDELRHEARERRLEPRPLSVGAVAALVSAETGLEEAGPLAEVCHEATAGNPFLLAELSRALDASDVDLSDEGVRCLGEVAAEGVAASIRARLERLGGSSTSVARAVAMLEPNAEPPLVAGLAELPVAEVTEAGERLIAAGLLTDSRSSTFVHPLIRDAVLSDLPEPRRAALHTRAARLLGEAGFEADSVAAHLLLTAPAGDEWVVATLRDAAGAALGRGAVDAAVGYLRRAMREPPAPGDRLVVSRELGFALLRASDSEGIEVLRTVRAATEDPELRGEIVSELASSLGLRNGNEEAAGLIEDTLSELPDPAGPLGTMLHGWLLLQVLWGLERIPEVAMPVERPGPETLPGRVVLQCLAVLEALGLGSVEEAGRTVEASLARTDTLFEDALAGLPPQGGLVTMVLADRGGEVAQLFDLGIEGSRRRGVLTGIGGGHAIRSFAHFLDGELREAQADIEISTDVLRRLDLPAPKALWTSFHLRILLARGERGDAERLLDEHWSARERVAGIPGAALLCARGELRAAAGRHGEAKNDFLAAAERIAWLPYANPEVYPWRIGLAGCEAALGNDEEARRLTDEAVALARRAGGRRGIGIALCGQGRLAGGQEGIEPLREAVRVLGDTRARLQHARALVELGAALRRMNCRKEAREPLREGLELAHRCGAVPLEERARTELAATGARPRKAVFTGLESLTPSELRVARMAADGMTNREIAQALTVTAKTVETHMRHVFQKLDIDRREMLTHKLAA